MEQPPHASRLQHSTNFWDRTRRIHPPPPFPCLVFFLVHCTNNSQCKTHTHGSHAIAPVVVVVSVCGGDCSRQTNLTTSSIRSCFLDGGNVKTVLCGTLLLRPPYLSSLLSQLNAKVPSSSSSPTTSRARATTSTTTSAVERCATSAWRSEGRA